MSEGSEKPAEKDEKKIGLPGAVFGIFALLIAAGLIVFFSFVWLGKQGMNSATDAVVKVVAAFKPEEVVETFDEWRALEAKGNEGNILEVATATSTERFSRKTNLAMFGKTLPLGTTVSEISVPATYRYHIDISDEWFVTSDGKRLLVLAPELRPSLPVAFDTASVQKKSQSGWGRWDGDANMEELERTITSKLEIRASDEATLSRVRDASREAVAKFVKSWLLSREAWGENKFEEIVVMFEGEEGALSSMPAVIEVGNGEAVLP
ncbi:MAG: hypothetical protein P1U68_15625 [Verrucomicrobiales bacterium]|nr:hypothetical protein [Verrucomicrobiales bacterium]